ncbi:MAG TPA: hypothetical protein VKS79_09570 [Gemmataceae bacterium]|nr:hypothetical protein [Gemmataceae bacterium]
MNELRPRDLAIMLLASGDLLPRQRARDQQADRAGLDLKRRLLDHMAAVDPEPDAIDTALAEFIESLGPPSGPARGLALEFREEWQAACAVPAWTAHLLQEALNSPNVKSKDKVGG